MRTISYRPKLFRRGKTMHSGQSHQTGITPDLSLKPKPPQFNTFSRVGIFAVQVKETTEALRISQDSPLESGKLYMIKKPTLET